VSSLGCGYDVDLRVGGVPDSVLIMPFEGDDPSLWGAITQRWHGAGVFASTGAGTKSGMWVLFFRRIP
jgi:hypothetical protein